MPRKIIHLDLDAFFCAVEELHAPSLRGKPFAVGGQPDQRGVVASCSYPARMYGVHSAMPMSRALLLCPQLIVVPGRHGVYDDLSHQVMRHCYDLTNLVEQISIDEAFLDVSDLRASAETIARELQATIWNEHGLPCSLGVATNKLVAKIANNIGKAEKRSPNPPMAIKVVPPGEEAAFLAPLPVGELWGIGPKTAASLTELGITTIGDVARWPQDDLVQRFGKHGLDLSQRARGIDDRPVITEYEAKSLSRETTFAHDVTDEATLRRTLLHLAESVGHRLRRAGLQGSTVKLKLRWADFTTITRQVTLPEPTDQDNAIYTAAQHLFEQAWPKGKPVRLIGVGVSNLGPPLQQLGLWETPSEKGQRLQDALDAVRDRFGHDAIKRASDLDKE
ncbi:MAG: DNA polymerase IV [Anaerolineae bacterium]